MAFLAELHLNLHLHLQPQHQRQLVLGVLVHRHKLQVWRYSIAICQYSWNILCRQCDVAHTHVLAKHSQWPCSSCWRSTTTFSIHSYTNLHKRGLFYPGRFKYYGSPVLGDRIIGILAGADPGFQVRGGALKKIAPSGGRCEKFWGISCEKSRFYAKKSYFFKF
jgi:hypothetical protein